MIADCHVHLRDEAGGIDHSLAAVERFCARAADCGVDQIGFVEHVYYFAETRAIWSLPYQTERCVYPIDDYVGAVVEAQRRGLPVKLGLEVDWTPPRDEELHAALEPYPWDFLLGSVHWVDGVDLSGGEPCPEGRHEELWRRYREEVESAARSGLFDVLSHPDRPQHSIGAPPPQFYDALAEAAHAGGTALELSAVDAAASGSPLLDVDVDVSLTLASDAHEPGTLGRGVLRLAELLLERGRPTTVTFERRRRCEVPLA